MPALISAKKSFSLFFYQSSPQTELPSGLMPAPLSIAPPGCKTSPMKMLFGVGEPQHAGHLQSSERKGGASQMTLGLYMRRESIKAAHAPRQACLIIRLLFRFVKVNRNISKYRDGNAVYLHYAGQCLHHLDHSVIFHCHLFSSKTFYKVEKGPHYICLTSASPMF